jgi:hypothetical protein
VAQQRQAVSDTALRMNSLKVYRVCNELNYNHNCHSILQFRINANYATAAQRTSLLLDTVIRKHLPVEDEN